MDEDTDWIGASALRKASVRLIPLIAIAYGVAYTDRVNISFAALQMNRDLHFSASSYGLGAGLFFLSYAACEIPSNLLLYRFGARRWIARIMFSWGLLAMCMMFVKTPLEFYAVRFLLGMAEAGFFPGVVFYLSQWFPSNVRARTVSRLRCAAAQLCLHGRTCGCAAQSSGPPRPGRLAMAVSGGGFAGRDSQRHLSRLSTEHAGRSQVAHR